ncbi:MAG TPA: hypothetical protein VLF59_05980 [Candidatus Saccharimonadales bacterium]|nr:hypothetical protein [Candidatus Saccharimonadales bacterium]
MNRTHLKEVVCFDIDGTVSNDDLRRGSLPPAGSSLSDWVSFHEAHVGDRPIESVIFVLRIFHEHYLLHGVSGRFAETETTTKAWFTEHDVPYDELHLYDRRVEKGIKNAVYKVNYLYKLRARGLMPVLFIEDLPHVADYIEQHGNIPVLRVRPNYKVNP